MNIYGQRKLGELFLRELMHVGGRRVTADHIDAFAQSVRDQSTLDNLQYDTLDDIDGLSNSDLIFLIESIVGTQLGDANLDGNFDSSDLVQVFRKGLYDQQTSDAGWSSGDWNGDKRFNSADLILVFQRHGYSGDARVVPEPQAPVLCLLLVFCRMIRKTTNPYTTIASNRQ